MNRRRLTIAGTAVAGLAVIAWIAATREVWGPNVADDPRYRSGRESVCKAPERSGAAWPVHATDRGVTVRGRGIERVWEYTFDAGSFARGSIDVCSEYGSVALRGVPGTQGRIEVTLSSPFPGGDRAIADTSVAADLRARDGTLYVAVTQMTQGVTSFRSLAARGSRPTAVNVVIHVPRNGRYDIHLVANHQRMTVHDLEIRGVLEGYGSPGADIDARLAGPLKVEVDGVTYRSRFAGENVSGLRGGTTARLRALQSSSIEIKANQAAIDLVVVGGEPALDITATGPGQKTIDVGETETLSRDATSAHVRSSAFSNAPMQVVVRAASGSGPVSVRRVLM